MFNKFGIEFECGGLTTSVDKLKSLIKGIDLGIDTSVNVKPPLDIKKEWMANLEIRYCSEKIADIHEFYKTVFSLGFIQNSTCGNHIHISFKKNAWKILTYPRIISTFYREYQQRFGNQIKYIERMKNGYCKAISPRKDTIQKDIEGHGFRYKAVNFNALKKHGTVEFRIFPYFDNDKEANTTFNWLIDFLKKQITRNQKLTETKINIAPVPIKLSGGEKNVLHYVVYKL